MRHVVSSKVMRVQQHPMRTARRCNEIPTCMSYIPCQQLLKNLRIGPFSLDEAPASTETSTALIGIHGQLMPGRELTVFDWQLFQIVLMPTCLIWLHLATDQTK